MFNPEEKRAITLKRVISKEHADFSYAPVKKQTRSQQRAKIGHKIKNNNYNKQVQISKKQNPRLKLEPQKNQKPKTKTKE